MTWFLVGMLLSVVHVNESFEGSFPPAGWQVLDLGTQNNDSWERTSQTARTGTYSAAVFYGPQGVTQNEWLITPPLDLSGVSQVYMIFYEAEEYWSSYGDHHRVRVCVGDPSDTANFDIVLDMTPSNHTIGGFDGDPVTVDLSAYAGQSQVYVALQYTGVWADNWFVDDILIYSPEPHDVSAEALNLPIFVRQGTPYTPTVRVHNWGANTETFPLVLHGYHGSSLFYADTVTVSSLAPGTTQEVSLAPVTFPEAGSNNLYRFEAQTLLSGDGEPGNDTVSVVTYALSQDRRVLLELTTNTGCGPCAPANQMLDNLIETYDAHVAAIRYHAWWPSSSDPFYQANIQENTARIEYYGADYAPHLHMDGMLRDAEYFTNEWPTMLQEEMAVPAGFSLNLSGKLDTLAGTGFVVAQIAYHDQLPYSQLYLRAALVEDSLYYPAPNGEDWHHQVMRDMVPDPVGLSLSLSPGEAVTETLHFSVDPSWDWHHCEMVLFVQDDGTKHVGQSNRLRLTEMEYVAVEEEATQPLRPTLQVPGLMRGALRFTVAAVQPGTYEVAVYDVAGRRVWHRTLGVRQAQTLNLSTPALPSGVYLVRLKVQGQVVQQARTVILR